MAAGWTCSFPTTNVRLPKVRLPTDTEAVKYWMHNNMVTIKGQKMGKSLGNFITLDQLFSGENDVLEQAYSPMTVRFFYPAGPLPESAGFLERGPESRPKGYERLMAAVRALDKVKASAGNTVDVDELITQCEEAIDDDLNTPVLISHLFDGVRMINSLVAGNEKIDG